MYRYAQRVDLDVCLIRISHDVVCVDELPSRACELVEARGYSLFRCACVVLTVSSCFALDEIASRCLERDGTRVVHAQVSFQSGCGL